MIDIEAWRAHASACDHRSNCARVDCTDVLDLLDELQQTRAERDELLAVVETIKDGNRVEDTYQMARALLKKRAEAAAQRPDPTTIPSGGTLRDTQE